jgi:hypothetical protein
MSPDGTQQTVSLAAGGSAYLLLTKKRYCMSAFIDSRGALKCHVTDGTAAVHRMKGDRSMS